MKYYFFELKNTIFSFNSLYYQYISSTKRKHFLKALNFIIMGCVKQLLRNETY